MGRDAAIDVCAALRPNTLRSMMGDLLAAIILSLALPEARLSGGSFGKITIEVI